MPQRGTGQSAKRSRRWYFFDLAFAPYRLAIRSEETWLKWMGWREH